MVAVVVWLMALAAQAQQPVFKLKKVVATGQAAPVPPQLSFVSPFSLNDNAAAAFAADGGILLKTPTALTVVAGFGDAAPGGGTFLQASAPSLKTNGDVVFRGEVAAPGRSGLFLYSGGALTQLVPDATFTPGGDIVFPDTPAANDAGDVAFVSFIGNGLFLLSHGSISKLAGPGGPAPGGDTFIDFSAPAINQAGQVVFRAFLASGNTGIFLASGGTITKVIATGDIFPDGGVFFFPLGNPSLDNAGEVAFAGLSNGPSADSGVFLFSGGQLSVVVPAFTPLPSGFNLFPLGASVGDGGRIAFEALRLDLGGSNIGVFLFSQGNVSTVMTPGTPSPDGDIFTSAFQVAINSSGQIGFLSRLTQHNDALYLSSGGHTTRLAGQGDTVARQPKFAFPFAFGLSNADNVLVFDQTFPGGIGLYNTSAARGPAGVTLDAHVGQSFGTDGVIQGFFENFTMNAQGQVVFNSDLSGGTSGIFLKSASGLSRVVSASFNGNGDPSPGGGTFLGVRQSSISNSGGKIAFSAFATNSGGIYVSSNGQISLAVDGNTPIPGGVGIFGAISLNAVNDQGQTAFLAQSFPFPNGMYVGAGGQFTLIARDGDPAPGGGAFSLLFPDPRFGPVINNNGDVAFAADLSTGGRGVFLFHQGTLTRIAGPGDPSPDASIFFTADAPTINSSGQVAFSAETGHGFGAFLFSAGTVMKVATPGDSVPPRMFLTFVDLPQVNDKGEVAFGAGLSTGEIAVFIARPLVEDDQDPEDFLTQPGPAPASPAYSRKGLKARYPRNFSFEKRQEFSRN
ncbi:MAG TPA: choice-of-anchor tandem repeat NxxGxxAF-containing protein [Candidatus Angelobacter sp.]